MKVGDHLVVSHGWYNHHGIYTENEMVIHYGVGLADRRNAKIECVSLSDFSGGREVGVEESPCSFDGEEVAQRARSRIGERCYDVFDNNCEHFANWCRSGNVASKQATYTRVAVRQSAALMARPILKRMMSRAVVGRTLAAPLVLADLAQAGVEMAAVCNGKSDQESERLGASAGAATSMGIGMMLAGPAGAATGFGLWAAGQVVGRAAFLAGQQSLNS